MKKVSIFIIVIMFLFQSLSYSQIHTADTDMRNLQNHGFSFKSLVIPATLISYGIATRIFQPLQQMDHNIANETAKHYKYHTQADNYLQYIPHTAVFGLNFIGIKSKHNLRDRTFIVAASSIITALIVQTSKRTTLIDRPDGSDSYSFPSGHTATAFAGAHILFKEYKDASPWIGIAGYGVALATGSMRILNSKHWFGDVVAGAGVGILSAELSYRLLPAWNRLLGLERKNKNFVIFPVVNNKQAILGLAYKF